MRRPTEPGVSPPRHQGVAVVDFVFLGLWVGKAESAFSNWLGPRASLLSLGGPQFPHLPHWGDSPVPTQFLAHSRYLVNGWEWQATHCWSIPHCSPCFFPSMPRAELLWGKRVPQMAFNKFLGQGWITPPTLLPSDSFLCSQLQSQPCLPLFQCPFKHLSVC